MTKVIGSRLLCTFRPQVWERDLAVSVKFENADYTWEVEHKGELPEEHSYESDALREDPAAPDWVRSWPGPFEVDYAVLGPLACKHDDLHQTTECLVRWTWTRRADGVYEPNQTHDKILHEETVSFICVDCEEEVYLDDYAQIEVFESEVSS